MKFKKAGFRYLIVFVAFIAGFIGFALYKYITEKPPVQEINLARESIAKAKNARAGKYASVRLVESEKLFKQAMAEWTIQNNKIFVFRQFSQVKDLATSAYKMSISAENEAGNTKDKYTLQVKKDLQQAEEHIFRFENYYKNLPVGRVNFDRFNKGKIEYLEAQNDFNKNDLQKARVLVVRANEKLAQAEKASFAKLTNFYKDYPSWQKNLQQAELLSRKGQLVILVNKMESTCTVLKSGKAIKVFNAEFGQNWMGDKIMKGDRCTPQGIYKISEKKRGNKTKYYKALLLDYPNNADKIRFDKLKKSGAIPQNAHIGGLIEIHGDGGKGVHWTDGCIALTNKDMDSIYELCSLGTSVVIIGSDITLDEYLSEVK